MIRPALGLLLAVAALTLAYATSRPEPSVRNQIFLEPTGAGQASRLEFRVPVADIHLGTAAASTHLLEGEVTPAAGRIVRDSEAGSPTQHFRYDLIAPAPSKTHRLTWGQQRRRELKLELNPDIPMSLTLGSDAGNMDLNLRDATIQRLDLRSQVGDTSLTLPRQGQYHVQIDQALGHLTIRLPPGLGARIVVRQRLGNLSVPEGFKRAGDVYTSAGFDQAPRRVDIAINSSVGDIRVEVQRQ